MYDDDLLRIPANEDEFWKILWDHFQHARQILWEIPVETKEDAITGTYRVKPKGSSMEAIRYRDTSYEYDNREHFLKMGRELLPYIHQSIEERQMSLEFVQQWGKFMFCHGYLASYFFEDSDDVGAQRAGSVRTRDAQRKWVATLIIALEKKGLKRQQAETRILEHIKHILELFQTDLKEAKRVYHGFDAQWFRLILGLEAERANQLGSTYRQNKFNGDVLRRAISEHPDLEIPSTELKLTQ